ncbi:sensor histidine kinase [Eupransor demetentiae]
MKKASKQRLEIYYFGKGALLTLITIPGLFFVFNSLQKQMPAWSTKFCWPFFCLIAFLILGAIVWTSWRECKQAVSIQRLTDELAQQVNQEQGHTIEWQHPVDQRVATLTKQFNQVITRSNQLHQQEEETKSSRDEMMTNISHDLRTPLTAIIGYLGLVVMQKDQLSTADRNKYIQTAYDKANQMKTLVEDLFEFSKTQLQNASLNITEFSVGDLFAQLLASYEVEAQEKGIELTYLIEPRLIIMEGDSDKLARVLMNLINNAFKYAKGATFIKLTAQVRPNDQVEIRVTNDGESIPQDSLDSLFDRFYRVESSRNSKTGGTGLGLAIVKGIVEQHHGQVKVESSQEATSFVVSLPIHQVATNDDEGESVSD